MEHYSLEQRIEIVKIHYRNNENLTDTCREVRALFCHSEVPSREIIMNLIKHFESVGHVGIGKTPILTSKVKSPKTISKVIEKLTEGSPSIKSAGISTNDSDKSPEENNDSSKGNDENQLGKTNSSSTPKATRKNKKPRHR